MTINVLRLKVENAYLHGRYQEALVASKELDKLILKYYLSEALKKVDCNNKKENMTC